MAGDYDPYAIHGRIPDQPKTEDKRIGEKLGVEISAANELRSIIERMERLAEEKSAVGDDEKLVMAEAKSRGYDTKAIRTIIRMRKKDPNELANEQSVLDTYLAALGMIGGA